jgi:acyl-CoA synthetase (NDP forming)
MGLDLLFNPKSIALIGASHTEEKLGGVILKNLLRFKGRVYPVNPKYDELMGIRSYRSPKVIPDVDLAIIIRPAVEVPGIINELSGKSKVIIVSSSGFAEIGNKGLQEEIMEMSRRSGIRILGPNCMGVFNPYKNLDTFFLPYERLKRPKKGRISIVSQSGAILSCIISAIRFLNEGLSKAVGYGNAVDIDESDLLWYLKEDESTEIVVSYVESVKDGRRFVDSAYNLSKNKPFIVLKAGKGMSGQIAAFSHTGRLAGRYEVFHSIIKRFGIKEVKDFDEMVDSIKAFSCYPKPIEEKGRDVLIVTNGGGSGVLAADECMRLGMEVKPLPQERSDRLRGIFPAFYGINNPVDLTAQVLDKDYYTALNELKDFYDGFLVIALPNVNGITDGLVEIIKDFREETGKPVVLHIPPDGVANRLIRLFERIKIPVYPSPERAVRALNILLKRGV